MSAKEYKSFYEESQKEYHLTSIEYTPLGYPDAGMRYQLRHKKKHPLCPYCDSAATYAHERKKRTINGGSFNGVPMTYTMERIRYMCGKCGRTFVDAYECLPRGQRLTTEAENYIIWSLGSKSMTALASGIGVSVQTIANRAKAFGQQEQEKMLKGRYRYLSMDEVFMGRNEDGSHAIYWVLNDISMSWKSNNILIQLGRTKDKVVKALQRLSHPEAVLAVSMDMWSPYRDAVEEALPNAVPVVDRFHVIKAAQESVNKARIAARCSKSVKDNMKKDASLFLSSMYKLSNDELDRLDGYLREDRHLETVYFLVQELIACYHIRDYDSALEYLCHWETDVIRSGVDLPVYATVCAWLPYIMNYFRFRITNGKTEGKNNLIRQIDRMGFHYGLDSLQSCLYAHDRRQEYAKWQCRLAESVNHTLPIPPSDLSACSLGENAS